MLRSLDSLRNHVLDCTDGELGRVHDFLIDDLGWTVRYLVVDTRKWLPGRRVVLSPSAFGRADWTTHRVPVDMSQQQVKDSPSLDEHAPVSRQHELELFDYFRFSGYPAGAGAYTLAVLPHMYPVPQGGEPDAEAEEKPSAEERAQTEYGGHLRSTRELERYTFELADAEIGHLEDVIVDEDWIVRYLVADLRRWLPGGRKVLVSPQWIEEVAWDHRSISVGLTERQLESCPDYDAHAAVNRVYEQRLYDYHGRPAYWL